ncbi:hypothetical protein [Clostridium saccharobutylicum]|uniref:Uncharacterized protein n=1 Tax=Clostridium saccharobutylicum TaxID=169679 RepID=A0A1S8N6G3_CLOSA|nr:hypothetical protein [Clostridium saccharobutylicum]OOM12054.1 hypothetical protein CLOSAC_24950 [Clostridium saccharobutylicum]
MGLFKDSFGKKETNTKAITVNNEGKYIIDFLKIRRDDITLKNVQVSFSLETRYIMINGDQKYFDAYIVDEIGWSEDNKYQRIITRDFCFWIKPKDYKTLKDIMMYRQKEMMEERKVSDERVKNDYLIPFEYDVIDDDIYKCFITGKTSNIESEVGTISDFRKIEEKLDSICKEHGGKYYKSEAKSAKFAIIFSYYNRTESVVNSLREKGYKVTSFENLIEHFELTKIWDTKGLKERVRKQKEYFESI